MVLRGPAHAIPNRLREAVIMLLLCVVHWHLSIVRCLVVGSRRREAVKLLGVVLLLLLIELWPAVGNGTHVARVRAYGRHLLSRLSPSLDSSSGCFRFVLDLVGLASPFDTFVAVLINHKVVGE